MPTALRKQQSAHTDRRSSEDTDWIRYELRKVFDETLNEPIPDRLQALLSKLRENEEDAGEDKG
ncbi:MAG: NepR family anti-sigma factor [Rhodospirillales bacterium]